MNLREELKEWIPMFLWEAITHPEGYIVTSEEFNRRWNLIQAQNDDQANTIKNILTLLYETLLSDTDGSIHLTVGMPEYAASNLREVLKIIDTRLKDGVAALAAHRVSTDHDFKYYTKTELIEGVLDERYYNKTSLNEGQLDGRYYTRAELTPWLRGGDTLIREEVYLIVTANNGDGTFTYQYGGLTYTGELTLEGYQIFPLYQGTYLPGANRLEVIINDTLRRSVASGGIIEIDETHFAITEPEWEGAEITIKYYERIGMAAEYNIKVGHTKPPQNDGKTMWFELLN